MVNSALSQTSGYAFSSIPAKANQLIRAIYLSVSIHANPPDVLVRHRVQLVRGLIALLAVQIFASLQGTKHMLRQLSQDSKQRHADKQAQVAVVQVYAAPAFQLSRHIRLFPPQNLRMEPDPPVRAALNRPRVSSGRLISICLAIRCVKNGLIRSTNSE